LGINKKDSFFSKLMIYDKTWYKLLSGVDFMSNDIVVADKRDVKAKTNDHFVFVTLYVNGQLFGLPVDRVQDILIPEKIAKIPLATGEIAGAINLRGKIVTVIDVRKRLGLPNNENSKNMCATVELGNELYSLVVDDVGTVMEIEAAKIEPNVSTLDSNWRAMSQGVVRLEGELLIILDVDEFMNFNKNNFAA